MNREESSCSPATMSLEVTRPSICLKAETALAARTFAGTRSALTRSLSPDFDSFYWNDPGARAAADEIWGLAPEGDAACLNAAH